MTSEPILGWPFLVARGRQLGYQLLLAPEFILTSRESALLMDEVRAEVPESGPPVITDIAGPASGAFCLVYRSIQATCQEVGDAGQAAEPLLDRAGRPIVWTYGFACRGARVVTADDEDLRVARDAALATYRRFRAAEERFLTRTSHPYALRSAVTPAVAAAQASPGPARCLCPYPSAAD